MWAGFRYAGVRTQLQFDTKLLSIIFPDTPQLLNKTRLLFRPGLYLDEYGRSTHIEVHGLLIIKVVECKEQRQVCHSQYMYTVYDVFSLATFSDYDCSKF